MVRRKKTKRVHSHEVYRVLPEDTGLFAGIWAGTVAVFLLVLMIMLTGVNADNPRDGSGAPITLYEYVTGIQEVMMVVILFGLSGLLVIGLGALITFFITFFGGKHEKRIS